MILHAFGVQVPNNISTVPSTETSRARCLSTWDARVRAHTFH